MERTGDRHALLAVFVVLAMAGAATAIVVASSTMSRLSAAALLGGLLFPVVGYLTGNVRLFLQWCFVLSITFVFSKYFTTIPHQGGEYAFRIEVSDIFLGGLCLLWIGDMARTGDWRIRIPRPALYWSVLILLALYTALFGFFRILAAMEVQRMTKLLILLLLVANTIRRRGQMIHLVLALLVIMVVQSGYGLLQYFFDISLGLSRLGEAQSVAIDIAGESRKRIGSLLGHPNIMSGYMAMVLPLCVAMLFSRLPLWLRVIGAGVAAMGAVALVLTLSRNGWISFSVGLIVVLVLSTLHLGMRRRTPLLRACLIAIMVLGVLAVSKTLIDRLLRSDPMSLSARWELNMIAAKMIMARPLLGFGKNSAPFVITSNPQFHLRQMQTLEPENVSTIHNSYLLEWAEQGTIGFFFFAAMMVTVLRYGIGNLKVRDDTVFAINIGMVAGICGIMMHCMADWVFWWNGITRLYFLFAGVIMAIHYWRLREEASGEPAEGAPPPPRPFGWSTPPPRRIRPAP